MRYKNNQRKDSHVAQSSRQESSSWGQLASHTSLHQNTGDENESEKRDIPYKPPSNQ